MNYDKELSPFDLTQPLRVQLVAWGATLITSAVGNILLLGFTGQILGVPFWDAVLSPALWIWVPLMLVGMIFGAVRHVALKDAQGEIQWLRKQLWAPKPERKPEPVGSEELFPGELGDWLKKITKELKAFQIEGPNGVLFTDNPKKSLRLLNEGKLPVKTHLVGEIREILEKFIAENDDLPDDDGGGPDEPLPSQEQRQEEFENGLCDSCTTKDLCWPQGLPAKAEEPEDQRNLPKVGDSVYLTQTGVERYLSVGGSDPYHPVKAGEEVWVKLRHQSKHDKTSTPTAILTSRASGYIAYLEPDMYTTQAPEVEPVPENGTGAEGEFKVGDRVVLTKLDGNYPHERVAVIGDTGTIVNIGGKPPGKLPHIHVRWDISNKITFSTDASMLELTTKENPIQVFRPGDRVKLVKKDSYGFPGTTNIGDTGTVERISTDPCDSASTLAEVRWDGSATKSVPTELIEKITEG